MQIKFAHFIFNLYICLMEFVKVKFDSAEWEYMWDFVSTHPINEGIENPHEAMNDGEVWQYMGTYKNKNKYVHEFIHKQHPKTNEPYKISINGSDNVSEDQFDIRIPIK